MHETFGALRMLEGSAHFFLFGTQPIKNIQKLDIDNTMQPKRAQNGIE